QRARGDGRHFVSRIPGDDGDGKSASGAEGGLRTGVHGRHVAGRRLLSQRSIPAELWIRVHRAAGDVERELQLSVRPIRHLRVLLADGRAFQRELEVFSREDSDVERVCGASELQRVLEAARGGVHAEKRDGAEPERRRLVGPGRPVRATDDVRAAGKDGHQASELSGGRAVESRRMGARSGKLARRNSLRQRYGGLFPREGGSAVVRLLAARERLAAAEGSAAVPDGERHVDFVRFLAAKASKDGKFVFPGGREAVV